LFWSFISSALLTAPLLADVANVQMPRYPSISPDGSTVVFSYRGDLWRTPLAGGRAERLTVHPLDELLSVFSPDGKQIAFTSERTGGTNIFVMNADGTGVRAVTNTDRVVALSDWTRDGQLAFSGRIEPEAFNWSRPYSVSLDGGEPSRLFDAYGMTPVVSPDGSKVLFVRGTTSFSRRGYRGSDNRDVWLYDRNAKTFTRLTTWAGGDGKPKWIDDSSFAYVSDRANDRWNIYKYTLGAKEDAVTPVTSLKDADVDDFAVAGAAGKLVYTSWDGLYSVDLKNSETKRVPLLAEEDIGDTKRLQAVDRSVSDATLSPDGKAVAIVSYGQVYVRSADPKSPARRVSDGVSRCRDVAWSPDSSTLYFVSDASGIEGIYAATVALTRDDVRTPLRELQRHAAHAATQEGDDEAASQPASQPATQPTSQPTTRPVVENKWPAALKFKVEPFLVPDDGEPRWSPALSPDGKLIAFRRGRGQLWVMSLRSKQPRMLYDGWSDAMEFTWHPSGRYIAYVGEDTNQNSDIFLVRVDGKMPAVNLTKHPDDDRSPRFSADGRIMAFTSQRIDNESDVWQLNLDPSLDAMSSVELDEYFKNASAARREPRITTRAASAAAASGATTRPASSNPRFALDESTLDTAYLRLKRLTSMPGSEGNLQIAPAGDKVYFTGQAGATRATFVLDRDATEPRRLGSSVGIAEIATEGDRLVGVESNRAAAMKLPAGEIEYYDISDRLEIDLRAFNERKFREAARILGREYYDGTMNGLDWKGLTDKYASLIRGTTTGDEFDFVANRMLGELNGSHLGISSPSQTSAVAQPQGRLGIERKRVDAGYEVTRVFDRGPAFAGLMQLRAGDVITAIEGKPIGKTDTLESLLTGQVGREVLVTVTRAVDGAPRELNLLLVPISAEAEGALAYDDWRNRTAKKVAELSGGALGYIHIRGMDQGSLDVFERDLFAAADGKKGLIVDVRNNGGGSTTDLVLASIMVRKHAYTIPRGAPKNEDAYPQDRLFIQRYTLPMNALCNERSFSNAEIFSHAFKTLQRGTLVGVPTAGGVISTGGTTLLDGTTVRLPGRGWYLPDGTNMERHGAEPDLLVPQTPESETAGDDVQLKAAVEDLMKRVGK
jgi:tricorn protease